jgi:hypothetical protein
MISRRKVGAVFYTEKSMCKGLEIKKSLHTWKTEKAQPAVIQGVLESESVML